MWTLAVETSRPRGGAALARDDEPPVEAVIDQGLRHGEDLAPAIERLLSGAGIAPADLGLVVAGTGPGSFTGIRIGLITAKALAWALRLPAVGVPSVEATAVGALAADRAAGNATPARVGVVVGAGMGVVYAAWYAVETPAGSDARLVEVPPMTCVPPAEVVRAVEAAGVPVLLTGDAVADVAREISPRPNVRLAPEGARHPSPATVLRLGIERFRRGAETDPLKLAPLYIRDAAAVERARK